MKTTKNHATATIVDNDDNAIWYQLNGRDYGTEVEFTGDIFGVTDGGDILNSDGYPPTDGDIVTIAVRNTIF
jgi:hypothetical protein